MPASHRFTRNLSQSLFGHAIEFTTGTRFGRRPQLCLREWRVLEIERLNDVVAMCLSCFHAEIEQRSYFLGALAFSKQLDHRALTLCQVILGSRASFST